TAANITYYCKIVNKTAVARKLVSAGTEIATRGTDPEEDVIELMDYAQKTIMEIADKNTVSGSVHLKELMHTTYKTLRTLYNRKEKAVNGQDGPCHEYCPACGRACKRTGAGIGILT
ncbi:MAG: hypothetical protein JZU65_03190, partial [Chlorobium sp.]|nr:hypothetical protein [Chlorobium sp.]